MHLFAQQLLDLVRVARDVLEVLRQIVHRAGIQRIEGDPRAFVRQRGKHQHRRGTALHDLPDRGDAVHHRHLVIHGDDVRLQRQHLIDRLAPVGGGADDLDIGIRGKDFRDTPAKETGIVDDQDLDCHTSLLATAPHTGGAA